MVKLLVCTVHYHDVADAVQLSPSLLDCTAKMQIWWGRYFIIMIANIG